MHSFSAAHVPMAHLGHHNENHVQLKHTSYYHNKSNSMQYLGTTDPPTPYKHMGSHDSIPRSINANAGWKLQPQPFRNQETLPNYHTTQPQKMHTNSQIMDRNSYVDPHLNINRSRPPSATHSEDLRMTHNYRMAAAGKIGHHRTQTPLSEPSVRIYHSDEDRRNRQIANDLPHLTAAVAETEDEITKVDVGIQTDFSRLVTHEDSNSRDYIVGVSTSPKVQTTGAPDPSRFSGEHEEPRVLMEDNWSVSDYSSPGPETAPRILTSNDKNRSPRALQTPKPDLTQSPILGLDRLITHLQSMPKVPEITTSKEVAFKNNQKMSQALNSIQYADKFRTNSLRSKYNSNFSNETANTNSDYQGRDFSSADFVLRNNEKEGTSLQAVPTNQETYQNWEPNRNKRQETKLQNGKVNDSNQFAPETQQNHSSSRSHGGDESGYLQRLNEDGSQDIEIFRPGKGESFGFYVFREPTPAIQTNRDRGDGFSDIERRRSGLFVSRLKDNRFQGLLNVGDEVVSVNGHSVRDLTLDEVEDMIMASAHSVTMTTIPYLVSIQNNS
ncbi:uncharacterized protein LOC134853642 [Symsagittifera roscoffensis]|uniref:uncharacterized protein LOC134853642 n=1 Tax=Symsagittifera roscoffensis TaxID=84072 RepID=UPI00307B36B3